MKEASSLSGRVMQAVMWRSGTQILSQLITWTATIAVLRILDPSDYGLFAMSQVVLAFLAFLSGHGFASSLIQSETVSRHQIRQAFGMLLLLNSGIAGLQLGLGELASLYYRQPLVAELLRWQALIYLANPFLVLPQALMMRRMDFRKPAVINLIGAAVSATTAIGCALAGWGVWTLVAAPIALFWTRAICLTVAERLFIWPSFDFTGASRMFGFGSALMVSHFFWTIQMQSDILIAGRFLDPHGLGLYAEALFIAQMFASRFVPPLNEVAFPAYAQLQDDRQALASAFCKASGLILLIALPFSFGMAVVAEPLILAMFGEKWADMVPFIRILAAGMPLMTMTVLFSPATNAVGLPFITMKCSMIGAVIMPLCYLFGVQFGTSGLAWSALVAMALMLLVTFRLSKEAIGLSWRDLPAVFALPAAAAGAMALLVIAIDSALPPMAPLLRLLVLSGAGAAAYAGLLYFSARATFRDVLQLVLRRKPLIAA